MRIKKFLAGILSAALVLSTTAVQAFASEGDVAEVNGTGYATMIAAFEAAKKDDTIKLLADGKLERTLLKCGTVDLNGKTLTLTGQDYRTEGGVDVTFKNGTIKATNVNVVDFGLFTVYDDEIILNDVDFVLNGLTCEAGTYLVAVANGGAFRAINGTTVDIDNCANQTLFANNGGTMEFSNATVDIDTADTAFLHYASFTDSTVTIKNVADGLKNGTDGTQFLLKNSSVTVENSEIAVKLYEYAGLELINSSLTVTNTGKGIFFKNVEKNLGAYPGAYVKFDDDSTVPADTNAEAKTDNAYYATFNDAVGDIKDGEKVSASKDGASIDEAVTNAGFEVAPGNSNKVDVVAVKGSDASNKTVTFGYTIGYDGSNYPTSRTFSAGDVESDGTVTFGVLLYNIPTGASVSAPTVTIE